MRKQNKEVSGEENTRVFQKDWHRAYMGEIRLLFFRILEFLKRPAVARCPQLVAAGDSNGSARCDQGNELALRMGKWLLVLIILFVLFVRIRLLEFPLERDEGEYAYMGQLLLEGTPPYSQAYNMKFPGIYMAYGLIMSAFGQTIRGIHLGLMLVNFATILLVYFLGRKTASEFAGIIAAITYAVLSLSFSVLGFAAHATHFVLLPAIGGILLLLDAAEKNKSLTYFWSGTLLGLSIVILQTGVFFFLFGASYIVYHHLSSRRPHISQGAMLKLGIFAAGALLPLLATSIWLLSSGVFKRFWFWTIEYSAIYGSLIPWTEALDSFRRALSSVTRTFLTLWIISALGFIIAMFRSSSNMKKAFIIFFAAFSFLSICPGFYFRKHYFVTLLPAISLCVGIFFHNFKTVRLRLIGLGIFVLVVTAGIINHKGYFFKEDPTNLSKQVYESQPFFESIQVARFVELRSAKTDRIAVLGSEPQIYFYSKRLSADGYIYANSLMEKHAYALQMQKEMISEIRAAEPKFIIVVQDDRSWGLTTVSVTYIFRWANNYLHSHYNLVGVIDIISPDRTVYKWDGDVENYVIRGLSSMRIFERKHPIDLLPQRGTENNS